MRGKVIRHQKMTLIDVQSELESKYGIESQELLQRLWHALQIFSGFPTSRYLLQNDTKQFDCVKVHVECNDK